MAQSSSVQPSRNEDHIPQWINNDDFVTKAELHFRPENSKAEVPACNETVSGADAGFARQAADSAWEAFKRWSNTSAKHRRTRLMALAQVIRARRSIIVETMMQETHMTRDWANGVNLDLSVDFIEELACSATSVLTGSIPPVASPNRMALVSKVPYGVVLAVVPWNAPFILAIRAIVTPILCGNTAILKASELSPRTHYLLGSIFKDAGFAPGVLTVLQASRDQAPEVIEALIAHRRVRKVNFTGSSSIGRRIAETAGRHLKPILLELGGKAPAIVLEDADLDKAAEAVVAGAFLEHGQICMSTERVIVHDAVLRPFTDLLVAHAARFPAGAAVTRRRAEHAQRLVSEAVAGGAKLIFGTNRLDGARLEPSIVTDVTSEMRLYDEESFGPTLVLIAVSSEDEAVRVANDTEYGLSASIFTANDLKGIYLSKRLESGACHVNAMTVHDEPTLPHGGVKSSGHGRFGVPWGLDEFLQAKTITMRSGAPSDLGGLSDLG